jgi:hypothetical protein
MGIFFSMPFNEKVPDMFIKILVNEGLSQIYLSMTGIFRPSEQIEAFSSLSETLSKPFIDAYVNANIKAKDLTPALIDFVTKQLAHHVMKILLENYSGSLSVRFDELEKEGERYELIQYPPFQIISFLANWQANDNLTSLFLYREPKLPLDVYLVQKVTDVLETKMDLSAFINAAITHYLPDLKKEYKQQADETITLQPLDDLLDEIDESEEEDENGFVNIPL